MSVFQHQQGALHCEGVPLEAIAEAHGTPTYVYSRQAIESAFLAYQTALADRPHLICYAVKANSNLAVLHVLAGLGAAQSEWVLAMDGDGQCDPRDIVRLWDARTDVDIVIGDRQQRCDSAARRVASRAFGLVYRTVFRVGVADPSCPLVLLRRAAAAPLLPALGHMPYGWWWEFVAAAHRHGLMFAEVPIAHRPRRDGETQVFSPLAMPRLAVTQLGGLARLWLAMRRSSALESRA